VTPPNSKPADPVRRVYGTMAPKEGKPRWRKGFAEMNARCAECGHVWLKHSRLGCLCKDEEGLPCLCPAFRKAVK